MVTAKSEAVILYIGIGFFFPQVHHFTDTLNSICCFILQSLCFARSFSSQPLPLVIWVSQYHVHTVPPQLPSLFNIIYEHLNSTGESSDTCGKPLVTSFSDCKSCPFTAFSFLNLNKLFTNVTVSSHTQWLLRLLKSLCLRVLKLSGNPGKLYQPFIHVC